MLSWLGRYICREFFGLETDVYILIQLQEQTCYEFDKPFPVLLGIFTSKENVEFALKEKTVDKRLPLTKHVIQNGLLILKIKENRYVNLNKYVKFDGMLNLFYFDKIRYYSEN